MALLKINNQEIDASSGMSIFQMAKEMDIAIPSSCHQQGKCKECLIEIKSGHEFLSPPSKAEAHLTENFRLACEARISGNGDISCQTMKRSQIIIEDQSAFSEKEFQLDPAVKNMDGFVFLDNHLIDRYHGSLLGLAIDIGTTTVVVKLVNLENGHLLATHSFENPQRYAGSNVMSRILYDTTYGKKELKRILTAHLAKAIHLLTDKTEQIYEVVVGGNTTMRDLFFGLDVKTIGQTPYTSISENQLKTKELNSTALVSNGRKMGLPIFPKARVYGLPLIGSHVGADTTATLLAIDFEHQTEPVIIMDIGTNTEIVIGHKDLAFSASSPSGPAFEGGGITFGMPALPGAIEKIKILEDGQVQFKTINNQPEVGICGSGLIDILGELIRTEQINSLGRLEDDDRFMVSKESNIYLSENDINLLAQTKGANAAALNILIKEMGLQFKDIQKFYIAGGFGRHLDIEASIKIGLLPDLPRERFVQIGNAAIDGCVQALRNKKRRNQYEQFVQKIKTINLESDPDFFDYFVNGCQFIPIET